MPRTGFVSHAPGQVKRGFTLPRVKQRVAQAPTERKIDHPTRTHSQIYTLTFIQKVSYLTNIFYGVPMATQ